MELETLHGRVYTRMDDAVYVTVPWTRFLPGGSMTGISINTEPRYRKRIFGVWIPIRGIRRNELLYPVDARRGYRRICENPEERR